MRFVAFLPLLYCIALVVRGRCVFVCGDMFPLLKSQLRSSLSQQSPKKEAGAQISPVLCMKNGAQRSNLGLTLETAESVMNAAVSQHNKFTFLFFTKAQHKCWI